jgi:MvdD pre-ATP grasp domain
MTAQNQIVIITEAFDPHADYMIRLLREMGEQPLRLHPADLPQRATLSFSYTSAGWNGAICAQGRMIDVNHIRSIWWRRPNSPRLPLELSEEESDFAGIEWQYTMRGVWDAIDCYWMSAPHHIALASGKPSQLVRAAALGFEVPRTLITIAPDEARAFYDACDGQIIYKVLSDPLLGLTARIERQNRQFDPEQRAPLPPDRDLSDFRMRGVHTTLIKAEQLAMLETIRLTPCLFQEYVPKSVELRVTVVGDQVFAAEIDSQANERTRIDWRHYDVEVPYRAAELPPDVAERCYALTRSYGLNFGAIDLILTPDGRYVFLEINPNGQWLWVQKLVPELKIGPAIADRLIQGNMAA